MFRTGRLTLATLLAIGVGVASQPARPLVVCGKSMSPTYADHEVLWTMPVDRPLMKGDVVVAETEGGTVIKRIALMPGDIRTQFRSTIGWVDMVQLGLKENRQPERVRKVEIPEGMVYLLGDDLIDSIDSRTYGLVPIKNIKRIVLDQREPAPNSMIAGLMPSNWIAGTVQPMNL